MHQYTLRPRGTSEPSRSHELAASRPQAAPAQARADALGHRLSSTTSSAPIQLTKQSKFESKKRRHGHIYTIRQRSDNKVVYVGQTDQTIKQRWAQHLREKPWLDRTTHKIRRKRSGKWTPFRTTAYEQHYINKYGGVGKLRNKINAMTRAKYNKHKGLHKSLGHRTPY
jgi:hypothetical protein